jgi:hypothetical protein
MSLGGISTPSHYRWYKECPYFPFLEYSPDVEEIIIQHVDSHTKTNSLR